MEFGIPREVRDLENRVALTPAGAAVLEQAGHTVDVESSAGAGAGFPDANYVQAGAQLVYSAAELYGRSDVVVKVTRPVEQEHQLFRKDRLCLASCTCPVASPDLLEALVDRKITAVAYELIQEDDGCMPVLFPMSETAGRLAPVIAGELLMTTAGGRGILLSGIPGVPPAEVVIIGAGVLGTNAARGFLGAGSSVTVLDSNMRQLQRADEVLQGRIATMVATEYNLTRTTRYADVVVGAVQRPGRRAPVVVTRDMVAAMKRGAVLIDFSIDQGGCAETSRPTILRSPTYVEEGVIHYCVPNLTAAVARTTSHAITNAAVPFLLEMADFAEAMHAHPALARGIVLYQGRFSSPEVAAALGREVDRTLPEALLLGGVPL